ncbi:MAG TPA: hypothetical protein PLX23_02760 [Candidatus Hydrogenedens sp.]|nr:hypothetical protein [Candidatus Hydrogenedens sp.]
MPRIEVDDCISDYERAVCYFTLPHLIFHLNPIILFTYFVSVIFAFLVTFMGLIFLNPYLSYGGTIALVIIILYGIIAITGKTLLNELRWREYLAEAHGSTSQVSLDLPDPFEDHELYIVPLKERQTHLYPCVNREGEIIYFIEEKEKGRHWIIKDSLEKDVYTIHAKHALFSIVFTSKAPLILKVYHDDKLVAQVKPRFSFFGSSYLITLFEPQAKIYWVLQSGIFLQRELVGRIYQVRKNLYLDVQKPHFNLGILSLLISSQL